MKFTTALVTSLLLVTSAVAAPARSLRRKRGDEYLAGRGGDVLRASTPMIAASNTTANVHGPKNRRISYSTNWAGAVLQGSDISTAIGTFTIPNVKVPSGGSSSTLYSTAAWVGIDGSSCQSAILQAGVDISIQNSKITYDPWFEWYPDVAYDFTGITFSAGDSVTINVTASSKSNGVATIKNNSKNITASHDFTGQTSGSLCQTDAEWIVEDFNTVDENGVSSQIPLADYGTIAFTDASAATSSGSELDLTDAEAIIMISADRTRIITDVTISNSSVAVVYE